MAKKSTLSVSGTEVTIIDDSGQKFISLTDMLKAKDGDFLSRTGFATGIP
jgi:hypothetical protein